MWAIALKMLLGDRGKYLGIVTGIALASVLMIQQPGILISIFSRTYNFITDIDRPDIWVMDPMVQFLDDSQPIIYTTYTRAKPHALSERKMLSHILVKAKPDEAPHAVAQHIARDTGMAARTAQEFKMMTLEYFRNNTTILTNSGFVVVIGFIVGAAVTGQIFYNFTLDDLRYFAVFKAMGATDRMLRAMILLQALLVGFVDFGLGAGVTAIFAALTRGGTGLTMTLNWQLLWGTAVAAAIIVLVVALISVRRVMKLEPVVVFK